MSERLHEFVHRLAGLFRRRRLDSELDAELDSHLEMAVEQNIRRGMTAAEARREALRGFGGVEQVKEIYRDQRGLPMLETTLQDLRVGMRMLWRNPGFSMLVILCLTLGIGANASVFGWIEGVLFRPYPLVAQQDRLVVVAGTNRAQPGFDDISWPDFLDYRKDCTLFDSFVGDKIMGSTLSIGDRAERVPAGIVSANYFEALGVRPILGRGFEPADEWGRNAHPVTVISYSVWKERFHGDPGIIGKMQRLNGVPHTIVGVAPEGFYGTFVGDAFQFWVPASMEETFEAGGYKLEDRGARWIEGFARLKPGVTIQQAQQEISAVAKRLESDYPETNRGRGIKLMPLWQSPFNNAGDLRPTLGISFAAVLLVLLIACANLGNLLLVRSFSRRHEMTVRLAVGAGRGRLMRQLLTEGLILSTLAAAGGVLIAYWCRNLLVLFFPSRGGSPAILPGEVDWRVLAFSVGICVFSTLLCGLIPAIQASKIDLAAALKADSGGVVGARGRAWVRSSLVLVQVSLSFLLLVGAGLLMQSLERIRTANPGFSTNVLMSGVDLLAAGYDTQRGKNFEDELIDRLQSQPGVESATFVRLPPFSYPAYSSGPIAVEGYQPSPDEQPTVEYIEVGPGYFKTMGIPLVSGREFTRADNETAPLAAVVNETLAARYWRGEDAVGRRFQVKGRLVNVVGVAKLSRYSTLLEPPKPFFYVPMRQNFSLRPILLMRTSQSPSMMAPALIREMHAIDANLAPSELITMREHMNRSAVTSQQTAVALLLILGGLALLLAAIGLYGVMSYAVSQSKRELGLRMALGARASDVMRLVLRHGLGLTAVGIAMGAAAALGTTRLLGYLLYRVSPRDPLAFGLAFAVMAIVSLAACFLPAWRASRTDPVRALRE
ncbi:MAG TPA: ABC transporter permease [Candidatus Acidoferrales bacterium]|nr:ABC transporter permease [Candidatus Acidoferrales bacterium]